MLETGFWFKQQEKLKRKESSTITSTVDGNQDEKAS
jgi:hypothetical protein